MGFSRVSESSSTRLGVLLEEGAAGLALQFQVAHIVRLGQLDFLLAELQRGDFFIGSFLRLLKKGDDFLQVVVLQPPF